MKNNLNSLIGKEVQIYPGDSDSKFGNIEDITDQGILFKITKSKSKNFTVGKLHFIAFSARLSFTEV
jgi:hypothetical protein